MGVVYNAVYMGTSLQFQQYMVCVDMICAMYNKVVSMGSQQLFLFHNQPLQFKVIYINNVLKNTKLE